MKKLLILLTILILTNCKKEEVTLVLPSLISDNMVLQQNTNVTLWGWSNAGQKIEVKTSWGEEGKVKTGKDGKWKLGVKTPEYGGPYSLQFKAGTLEQNISNVMIGEVWLCSGQSNMEMPMKGWPPNDLIDNYKEEIANASYRDIRMFTVEKAISTTVIDKCSGEWNICSSETIGDFSATAYFFGLKVHKELGIPVGLIHSSWGGTPAESWTSTEHLEMVPGYESIVRDLSLGVKEFENYKNQLSKLQVISFNELPEERPFEKLDLGNTTYLSENLDVSDWMEISIPGLWEESVLPGFDGIVWLRKEFELPKDVYPEGFELYLGPVDDMDATYVNGVKIGSNEIAGVWKLERRYYIPESALKEGKNIIMVKVTDTGGGGGIYGTSGPAIYKGSNKIVDLTGNWKINPSALFLNSKIYVFEKGKVTFKDLPELKYQLNAYTPTVLYNAMIAPLIPYSIQGAIWYQGEANVGRGEQYKKLFPAMINCWRDQWSQGDFPFYYVQIAPYNYGPDSDNAVAELREAQLNTLSQNNVGMVVTMDVGNPENIHPGNKRTVGDRLAMWALSQTYGKDEIVYSGPIFKSAEFKNNHVEILFSHAGTGLELKSEESFFEIAGDEGVFYPARAEIQESKLILSSKIIKNPTAVRYAWGDDVEPNLFNIEGLPASPFIVKK